MRPLNEREKRTIRIGGVLIAAYLLCYGAYQGWRFFEKQRVAYHNVVKQAQVLRDRIAPYQTKAQSVKKLMESYQMDPVKLSRDTVVAQASAAVQRAAAGGGIQLGTVHESPSRPSSRELATLQLEGTGPIPAIMGLLGRLDGLGYPLIVDSVQLTADNSRPGQVKMSLTIVILDFGQWSTEEVPHA